MMHRTVPGDCHVLLLERDRMLLRGTASSTRRVFFAAARQLAGSSARLVADVVGASIDHSSVATRLSFPGLPPAFDSPMWSGVEAVPEGSILELRRAGAPRVKQWWSPPPATLSLREGSSSFGQRLIDAVRLRTASGLELSADVSGGLDSTPVAYLADVQAPTRLRTFTSSGRDGMDEDLQYATRALNQFRTRARIIIPSAEMPVAFADIEECDVLWDEPFVGMPHWKRISWTAETVRTHGSRLHLSGHGGDEVLLTPTGYVHDLTRRHPLAGLRRAWQFKSLHHWSAAATHRLLWERTSLGGALRKEIAAIENETIPVREAPNPWGVSPFRLPQWATSEARQLAVSALAEVAGRAPVYAATRAQHAAYSYAIASGRAASAIAGAMARRGVEFAAPLIDDQVLEAALRIRPDEKMTPHVYKPLMKAALGGRVPTEILARATKADGSPDVHRGHGRFRDKILDYMADSRLAELGLIDLDGFRTSFANMDINRVPPVAFWRTLALEQWLRTASAPSARPDQETT
jgi:asparagine synthase (glutamine-hydrolysing)